MAPHHGAANPASAHAAGRAAADLVETAREEVASLIGARPTEIVFTSGATEADNLAIGGVLHAAPAGHVVTASTEHKAVLETVRAKARRITITNPDGTETSTVVVTDPQVDEAVEEVVRRLIADARSALPGAALPALVARLTEELHPTLSPATVHPDEPQASRHHA